MKKFKLAITIKVFTFVSLVSLGEMALAQRVVDNGGGLAEMQAIYFHQKLGEYVQPCLPKDNNCRISDELRSLLGQFVQLDDSEKRSVKIVFKNEFPEDLPFTTQRSLGSPIHIFTRALYDHEMNAISSDEIAAIVLTARLAHLDSNSNLQKVYSDVRGLMVQMTIKKNSLSIPQLESLLAVHDYQMGLNKTQARAIFIEDETKTRDISKLVAENLPCGLLPDWNFENWRGWAGGGEGVFLVNGQAECLSDSNYQNYVMTIEFVLDGKGLLALDEPIVSFRPGF